MATARVGTRLTSPESLKSSINAGPFRVLHAHQMRNPGKGGDDEGSEGQRPRPRFLDVNVFRRNVGHGNRAPEAPVTDAGIVDGMDVFRRTTLRTLVALLACAAWATAVPAAHAAILSDAEAASFRKLQSQLGGTSGVAVSGMGTGQNVERIGSLKNGIAWSTSKVPVAMAVIAAGKADAQRSNLRAAITASDNAAAERLWSSLGAGKPAARAATAQLRAAGDRNTTVQSERLRSGFTPFGQTTWTVADQARFAAGMSCTKAGRAVLDLMGQTVRGQIDTRRRLLPLAKAPQRWGAGAQ